MKPVARGPDLACVAEHAMLHVEDDEAAGLLVQTALEESGSPVAYSRVVDVDEALAVLSRAGEHADARRPDFILLDLNLPRKTGFDFLTIVRSSESLEQLRVVVFTSSVAQADRAKSLELGANAYYSKPLTFAGYVSVLQEILHLMEVT